MINATEYERQHKWICEHILSSLPGADSSHVQRVFTEVTDRFLQESSTWIDEQTFFPDEFGNVTIDFSFIDAQMVWIHNVWNDDVSLSHLTHIPASLKNNVSNSPRFYTNTPYPNIITVNPTPIDAALVPITVRAALKMDDCSTADIAIPDWVFSRYKHVLRTGTLAFMQAEPGKSYSSNLAANKYEVLFSAEIAQARDEARRGFGFHEAEWGYPTGFYA